MSSHRRREHSPFVSEVIEDMRMKKMCETHCAYSCRTCSKATIREKVVPAEELHVKDPNIKYVVVHNVRCHVHPSGISYELRTRQCFRGDNDVKELKLGCEHCKYGIRHRVVDVQQPPNKRSYPVKVHRTFYECTNRNRQEQLNKDGVYMTINISCEYFEDKGE